METGVSVGGIMCGERDGEYLEVGRIKRQETNRMTEGWKKMRNEKNN